MSTEYRDRLRSRRPFGQSPAGLFIPARSAVASPARPTPSPAQVISAVPEPIAPPAAADSVAVESSDVVVPQPPGVLNPAELREHAKGVAAAVAQMPQEEYEAALSAMQLNNPTLYAVVVDELHNMSAEAQEINDEAEGDVYDLSSLTNPPDESYAEDSTEPEPEPEPEPAPEETHPEAPPEDSLGEPPQQES